MQWLALASISEAQTIPAIYIPTYAYFLTILSQIYLSRWYRELTSEVVLSTVLGHRVKVQQGDGTKLYNHFDSALQILTRSRGHLPFFLSSGGTYMTGTIH